MNINGLSKAAVLAALYNRSRPQGMGFLDYDPKPMTEEQAQRLIDEVVAQGEPIRFDYVAGRVMKVNLTTDEVDTFGFNRDNGENAAEEVIEQLRQSGKVITEDISRKHQESTMDAAVEAERMMGEEDHFTAPGVLKLGLSDVADHVRPAVERATGGRHRR